MLQMLGEGPFFTPLGFAVTLFVVSPGGDGWRFFTPFQAMVILLLITTPAWAGLIVGGLAAWFIPRLPVFYGLSIGLGVGIAVNALTILLTVVVSYHNLPIPWHDSAWAIPYAASVAATVGICWWKYQKEFQNP